MEPHAIHVVVGFTFLEMLVQPVPPSSQIVQHAHKMELHVIAVEVDFTLTQTPVQLVQLL